jgi:CDP-diacylglycerol--glycerol-3-phosphate 3-phosphatidyltransferase
MKICDLFEGRIATWSNLISLLRVVVSPVVGILLYYEKTTADTVYCSIAVTVYVLIALSDIVDGYLARYLHQVSRIGQFLDPVADKLTIFILSLILYFFKGFPLWLVIVIVVRDIGHIAAGAILFCTHDIQVRPSNAGKCMIFILGMTGFIYIINLSYSVMGISVKHIFVALTTALIVLSTVVHWNIYSKIYFTSKSVSSK